jgi:hypothetical protein
MRHFIFRHCASVFTAVILFTLLPVQASDVRVPDDPNVLDAVVVEIQPETVRGWVNAKRGTEIVIPWYDDPLIATIERVEVTEVEEAGVEEASKFIIVIAKVKAETIGNVVLTIGNDFLTGDITLTGAITIDTESYRLRSLGGDAYSLVQFDTEQLMPTAPDTDDPEAFHIGQYEQLQLHPARPSIAALPPRQLFEQLNAQPVVPGIFEGGLRIDILVAYSFDALDWAKANGYNNIAAEIVTMVENANMVLASSGIDTHLRLVGIAHVDYTVMDPAKLKGDLDNLGDGVGTLDTLHTLRDLIRADLVSLLVFNGTEKCGDGKPGCGWAKQSNMFLGLGDDHPGTFRWEQKFASKGFNVVSVYHAFNAESFMHEVGHNLGAHHDWYTYYHTTNPNSTADVYAHGWVIWDTPDPARTLMSYSGLCDVNVPVLDCRLLSIFSNPLLPPYFGQRLGDPAPGGQPHLLGPANNAAAINRMAQTVSNYRVATPTP